MLPALEQADLRGARVKRISIDGKAASLAECRQILGKVAAEGDGGRTGVHAVAVRISFEEFAAVLATAPDALPAGLQTLADASQSVLRGLAELPSEVSGQ